MQLIWASKLVHIPVCVRVAKISGLNGLVITLDDRGALVVSCISYYNNFLFNEKFI
jgi:PTHB1 N-terminus